MTNMRLMRAAVLVSVLLAAGPAVLWAQEESGAAAVQAKQQAGPRTVKESYNTMEVAVFENRQGSNFPDEYLADLQQQTVKKLLDAKVFHEVVAAGQPIATADARVIRVTGVITTYKPGSRAQRYFGGFGAGAAEINSKIEFVDAATGRPLMSQDLRAVLTGGLFGGKSKDAINDYVRQVVNKVKLMENMRIPAEQETGGAILPVAEVKGARTDAPQEILAINDQDWSASEQKLNQKAAAGYRIVDLTITGTHTGDAAFVRTDAIDPEFRYKLLRTILSSNLGKDMKKLAAEGYRVSPRTLVVLGNRPAIIMEKSNPAFKARYEYIVKETVLVSSGQKEVAKNQEKGYTLIGETEHGTAHILVFEKVTPTEQTSE